MSQDFLGHPADPRERDCDWCDAQAVKAFELFKPRKKIGLAQYLYACSKHTGSAERATDWKRNPKKDAA